MLSVATWRRSIGPSVRAVVVGIEPVGRSVGRSAIGMANENVEPAPSSDSTQIRPPCCSMTWREIASPRPVPPASPRTRARSTL